MSPKKGEKKKPVDTTLVVESSVQKNKVPKPDTTGMNIYQKILCVMQDVQFMKKFANDGLNYSTVSHDQVSAGVRLGLIDYGIHISYDAVSCETVPHTYHTRTGAKETYRCDLAVKIRWTNIDNPDNFLEGVWHGSGVGNDGKGVGMAYSFAVKSCMLKTLCIPTGDNEELYFARMEADIASRQDKAKELANPQVDPEVVDPNIDPETGKEWDDQGGENPVSNYYDATKRACKEHCEKTGCTRDDVRGWISRQYDGQSLEDLKDNNKMLLDIMKRLPKECVPDKPKTQEQDDMYEGERQDQYGH